MCGACKPNSTSNQVALASAATAALLVLGSGVIVIQPIARVRAFALAIARRRLAHQRLRAASEAALSASLSASLRPAGAPSGLVGAAPAAFSAAFSAALLAPLPPARASGQRGNTNTMPIARSRREGQYQWQWHRAYANGRAPGEKGKFVQVRNPAG